MSRLPASLKGAERVDIGPISVFTPSILTAANVAKRRNRNRIWGYVEVKGARVYWVLYGFVNDPHAYAKR